MINNLLFASVRVVILTRSTMKVSGSIWKNEEGPVLEGIILCVVPNPARSDKILSFGSCSSK